MDEDPAPELEEEAQDLRRRMWIAGQLYQAGIANGLPSSVSARILLAWYDAQLEDERTPYWVADEGDE